MPSVPRGAHLLKRLSVITGDETLQYTMRDAAYKPLTTMLKRVTRASHCCGSRAATFRVNQRDTTYSRSHRLTFTFKRDLGKERACVLYSKYRSSETVMQSDDAGDRR